MVDFSREKKSETGLRFLKDPQKGGGGEKERVEASVASKGDKKGSQREKKEEGTKRKADGTSVEIYMLYLGTAIKQTMHHPSQALLPRLLRLTYISPAF